MLSSNMYWLIEVDFAARPAAFDTPAECRLLWCQFRFGRVGSLNMAVQWAAAGLVSKAQGLVAAARTVQVEAGLEAVLEGSGVEM
jgi:hypothetical protein